MSTTDTIDKLWFLDMLVRIHVAGDANDDGLSVIESAAPQGFSPPLHIHHGEDEIFFILSGDVRFVVDGKEIGTRPGDTLLAPKGLPHTFLVTSAGGARWLTLTGRGDFERMVRTAGRPAESDEMPPRTGRPTPEQTEALAAICRENRIDLIGPPLA